MKNRLKLVLLIILTFTTTAILSAETDLAKYNLQQAYNYFEDNKPAAARALAEKSFKYDNSLPEYYYLQNLMTADSNNSIYQKLKNSREIVSHIDNNFFISELTMLRNAAKHTYNPDELDVIYRRILKFAQADDYLRYIDFLLRTKRYEQVLQMIRRIRPRLNSVTLTAYEVVARIHTDGYDFASYTRDIRTLRSNGYNPSAILWMRAMYSKAEPQELIESFYRMCDSDVVDVSYRLPILEA
ncbi:MAG: hypothetical protein J6Y01_09915, partial [Spirochaetales bacterium]|nr:hypothetical protein [Spirochaetales bacterium]